MLILFSRIEHTSRCYTSHYAALYDAIAAAADAIDYDIDARKRHYVTC